MFYLKDIGIAYVYHDLGERPCFEYCSEYVDEEGNKVYVPDSMYEKFIENVGAEED